MRDMVAATGVGKAFNEIIVDLNKDEEDAPDAVDIPFGILPNSGEIVLLQMDGLLTKEEWAKIVPLGFKACQDVYAVQKKALAEKYQLSEVNESNLEAAVSGKAPQAKAAKEPKAEKVKEAKAKKVKK